jgi:hypothetical protein
MVSDNKAHFQKPHLFWGYFYHGKTIISKIRLFSFFAVAAIEQIASCTYLGPLDVQSQQIGQLTISHRRTAHLISLQRNLTFLQEYIEPAIITGRKFELSILSFIEDEAKRSSHSCVTLAGFCWFVHRAQTRQLAIFTETDVIGKRKTRGCISSTSQ